VKTKLYSDPTGIVAAKLLAMFLAGLAASALWFLCRLPGSSIMMVFGAAFIVMAIEPENDWGQRCRSAFGIALFTGILQFGEAMLDQQKILQLFWWFGFAFFMLWRWPRRMAATIVIALGTFGITGPAGFQPGVDRIIAMLFAAACSITIFAGVEILSATNQIKQALVNYRLSLAKHLATLLNTDAKNQREAMQIEVYRVARVTNRLLLGMRFLLPIHRKQANDAREELAHLHVISRAITLLSALDEKITKEQQPYLTTLHELLENPNKAVTEPDTSDDANGLIYQAGNTIIDAVKQLQARENHHAL